MKQKKSFILKILIMVVISALLVASISATATAVEITSTAPENGDGTEESPYEISTKEELYWFAQLVNGELEGISQDKDACAILIDDIIVNEKVLENGELVSDVSGLVKWKPIGYTDEYEGVFDGKGHTISGLYCSSGRESSGVFSKADGKIKNLNIVDSYFKSSSATGTICGILSGFASSIYNCNVTAKVESEYDSVGGIAGVSWGEIEYCSFNGSIEGRDNVGGICGDSQGIICNSYNKGSVKGVRYVGGLGGCLCEDLYWENTSCNYNEGDVTGEIYVGGLFGILDMNTRIYNCYNKGTVVATESRAGGICGTNMFNELDVFAYVYYCLNIGDVYAPVYSGSLFGDDMGIFGEKNYYLRGTATDGGGYEQTGYGKYYVGPGGGTSSYVLEVTREDLESGELAYYLQQAQETDELVWGQSDYTSGSHPILTNDKAYAVDKYTNSKGNIIYVSGGTGDFDKDKVIADSDYEIMIKTALGETVEDGAADITDDEVLAKSDVNNDGVIDVLDVALLERKLSK